MKDKAKDAIQYVISQLSGYHGDIIDDYVESLEQQNTALQARIKELEEHKKCDGCKHLFEHTMQCMNERECERIISIGKSEDLFEPKGTK